MQAVGGGGKIPMHSFREGSGDRRRWGKAPVHSFDVGKNGSRLLRGNFWNYTDPPAINNDHSPKYFSTLTLYVFIFLVDIRFS